MVGRARKSLTSEECGERGWVGFQPPEDKAGPGRVPGPHLAEKPGAQRPPFLPSCPDRREAGLPPACLCLRQWM